jgi:hypothetical protein
VLTFANIISFKNLMAAEKPTITDVETTPSDKESSETSSSKKKKAGNLASFLVEAPTPAASKPEQVEKKPSAWDRIMGEKPAKVDNEVATDKEAELPAPEFATVTSELSQTEAESGELVTDEAAAIRQATAHDRLQEVAQEAAAVSNDEQLPELAVAEAFLERVEAGDDIAEAEAATRAEFELPEAEATESTETTLPVEAVETIIDMQSVHEGEVPLSITTPEAVDDEEDDDATATTSAAPPPAPAVSTATSNPVAGFNAPPASFNVLPAAITPNAAPAAPNTVSEEDAYYYQRRALQRGLVTGLVVGFLYGRRRGRIKAEKRFAPVQKKLEKNVANLQSQVYETEERLRKQVIKARASQPVKLSVQRLASTERLVMSARQEQIITSEPSRQKEQPPASERLFNHVERTPQPTSERIGRVLVRGNETVGAASSIERLEAQTAAQKANKLTVEKQVQVMTRAELLEISEKIAIDGASLRQIYETHLVGEQGLRRLVVEHLRGGDIHKVLRQELVEREIDFERDPMLRDRARASLGAGGSAKALDNLLHKAGVNTAEDDEAAAVQTAKAEHDKKQQAKKEQNRRLMDVGIGASIVILIALILVILMR